MKASHKLKLAWLVAAFLAGLLVGFNIPPAPSPLWPIGLLAGGGACAVVVGNTPPWVMVVVLAGVVAGVLLSS